MSQTFSRELMILAERVVRPLRLPIAKQKRLRTEFLQHLEAIYAEELAVDGDQAAALSRTQTRFGDAAELTKELQGTIDWRSKMQGWFEMFWSQRPEETVLGYVTRMMVRFLVFVSCLIALVSLDHHFFGTEKITFTTVKAALGIIGFQAIWLSGFLFLGISLGTELQRSTRKWGLISLYAIALFAVWPASLMSLPLTVGGTFADFWFPWQGILLGGLITLSLGAVLGVVHSRDMQYRREWATLPLDVA